MIRKTLGASTIGKRRDDGGRILISSGTVDRDKDRLYPLGARIDYYLRNPVVQYGHNYKDPWATVGRTNDLQVKPTGLEADFTLRPAANEADPQSIVRLLWAGGWLRTASVGILPIRAEANELGGRDFREWELLEWSLAPIPTNQEALRMALKCADGPAWRACMRATDDGDMPAEVVDALGAALDGLRSWLLPKAAMSRAEGAALSAALGGLQHALLQERKR